LDYRRCSSGAGGWSDALDVSGGEAMIDQRQDALQKVLVFAQQRAQAWLDAAVRAETRKEPALAIFFRNQAWRIENGRDWLDDARGKP
jgi:hypothetical protein